VGVLRGGGFVGSGFLRSGFEGSGFVGGVVLGGVVCGKWFVGPVGLVGQNQTIREKEFRKDSGKS